MVAERLAKRGESCLLIERRNHIGGNVYDYDDGGILVHKYGSHIFHTDSAEVWDYLRTFTRFYPFMHEVRGLVDGALCPIPFNLNSLYALFPQKMAQKFEDALLKHYKFGEKISILELQKVPELAFLSDFIFEKIFLHYTLKQWQTTPDSLDKSVLARVPVAISRDNRYFGDKFQGIPLLGYTKMCEKMADSPLIEVRLGCDWREVKGKISFERLFFSGAIDEYFDYELGELPYRSLDFDFVRLEKPYFQGFSVVNYPNNYDFTRIAEYKYFLDAQTRHTVVSFEYPRAYSTGLERYYPVPNAANAALYAAYQKKAAALKNVHFLGRLGEYRYFDMDDCIERALRLVDSLD